MELDYLKDLTELQTRVVILSRGRADTIKSHRLFPYATLVVPESELEAYRPTLLELVAIPDEIVGIGRVRNWILNHFDEKVIVMVDDDIRYARCPSGQTGHNHDYPADIFLILVQAIICALDLGVGMFGFNQTNGDVRKYNASKPFVLNTWTGGVIGVIGRDIMFNTNKFKTDIDFTLRQLLKKRIVWIDTRWSFVQDRIKNKGGNSKFRTKDEVKAELTRLKKEWGKYFIHRHTKVGEITTIRVERSQ